MISNFYDVQLQPSGLKGTQFSLMNHLKRLGPLTMTELSEAMRLERTTLIRNLKILEDMDLVVYIPEKKSKARLVELTEKGLKVVEAATPYWEQAQKYMEELLTKDEAVAIKGVLHKLEALDC